MRELTKQTIKPVMRFINSWGNDIHSLNTNGARYYGFTLDTYKGKKSWQGGFDWYLDSALKHEQYAIDLDTGKVYNQNGQVIMQLQETIQ